MIGSSVIPSDNKLWLGLTGGIGAGKSTVTNMLAKMGAHIIDADLIAREIVTTPEMLEKLAQTFGKQIITNTQPPSLNRFALAEIVFTDKLKLAELNALTHPEIQNIALEKLKEIPSGEVGIYDAAILLDDGKPSYLDGIIVVEANLQTRLNRLTQQRGMSVEDAKARVANQLSDSQRAQYADYTIDNSGSLEQLTAQVQQLWRVIQQHPKLQGQYRKEP